MLSIFMAAIFVFNGSGTVGRKINLYQGGGRRSTFKNKEGGRGGRGVKITFEEDHSAAVTLGVAGLFLLVAFVIVFVHLSSKKGGRVVARKLQ